jgi:hypothetical protein
LVDYLLCLENSARLILESIFPPAYELFRHDDIYHLELSKSCITFIQKHIQSPMDSLGFLLQFLLKSNKKVAALYSNHILEALEKSEPCYRMGTQVLISWIYDSLDVGCLFTEIMWILGHVRHYAVKDMIDPIMYLIEHDIGNAYSYLVRSNTTAMIQVFDLAIHVFQSQRPPISIIDSMNAFSGHESTEVVKKFVEFNILLKKV